MKREEPSAESLGSTGVQELWRVGTAFADRVGSPSSS